MTKATPSLLSGIPAVIMCGGKGTRLKSLQGDQQKCSSDIGGSSIILKICDSLIELGVSQFHFVTGFGSGHLIDHIRGAGLPIGSFTFHNPQRQTGTGNAVLSIRKHLPRSFLYHHGNIWFHRIAYEKLVGFHRWDRFSVRLLGLPYQVPLTHPRVQVDAGQITRIIDKAESSYTTSLTALAGVGLIAQHALKDEVPLGHAFECSLDYERVHCELCLFSGVWRHLETDADRNTLKREWGT